MLSWQIYMQPSYAQFPSWVRKYIWRLCVWLVNALRRPRAKMFALTMAIVILPDRFLYLTNQWSVSQEN